MQNTKKQYLQILQTACNEVHWDYYPQVEASELLYRVITLEDIYLPLTLGDSLFSFKDGDIDELIKRIDQRLAELKASEKAEAQEDTTGLRMLVRGYPGGGKSTLCKRLILAIINKDEVFFNKYLKENGLHFNTQSVPVYLDCKNIADMSVASIQSSCFKDIVYSLCEFGLGGAFSAIPKDAFDSLFSNAAQCGMTLVVDGWDEVLDKEREELLRKKLDDFLCTHPIVDLVVTIRENYDEPELTQKYTKSYSIQQLSASDIREFCKKWCQVILGAQVQRQNDYSELAEQILRSSNLQVQYMSKNPLDLSLLLTVSKNHGQLPENKADLFEKVIDLYVFWSTIKNIGVLNAKAIHVFLGYIACCFTKQHRLVCSHDELLCMINQCILDVEWAFSEDMSEIDANEVAKELSHTGILIRDSSGMRYSFANTRYSAHRQMQEYLTAQAILVGQADEEYNNKAPVDIFEDKYEIRQWREVILFLILMKNGRVRQELINRLVYHAINTKGDPYHYTNLLFEAIVNGADIRQSDKHKIYDLVFPEHITDNQIINIYGLLQNETSKTARDFTNYISTGFADSISRNDKKTKFRYAKAIIEATRASKSGISPFRRAEELIAMGSTTVDIVTGLFIVFILAWCKYAKISNAFKKDYAQYKMPKTMVQRITQLLANDVIKTELLECVKEAILAGFALFSDFFTTEMIKECYVALNSEECCENAELVVSMIPFFDSAYPIYNDSNCVIRERYLKQFNEEKEKKDYDRVIFTFSICAAIGCWSSDELIYAWSAMEKIYSDPKVDSDIGKARFCELNNQLNAAWVLSESKDNRLVYESGIKKLVIYHDDQTLSRDATDFLDISIPNNTSSNNNLAYLLRRGELSKVEHTVFDATKTLEPADLLIEGELLMEPFSLVNMALTKSEIYVNTVGNPAKGKMYLFSKLAGSPTNIVGYSWNNVIRWWLELACLHHEIEGLIVVHWLFDLRLFVPAEYDNESLKALISLANEIDENIEGLDDFKTVLEHTIVPTE